MAEPKIETVNEVNESEAETSRFQNFTLNHPRTAKVVGIVAITAVTFGALQWWKSRNQNALVEGEDLDEPFETSSEIDS